MLESRIASTSIGKIETVYGLLLLKRRMFEVLYYFLLLELLN